LSRIFPWIAGDVGVICYGTDNYVFRILGIVNAKGKVFCEERWGKDKRRDDCLVYYF